MASRKIEDLTPRMQEKIRLFESELVQAGHTNFKRCCTYRSQAEQNALWKRGRYPLDVVNAAYKSVGMAPIAEAENKRPVTWRTISDHTAREAVDYYIEIAGIYCNDIKVDYDGDHIPDWQEFGKIAEKCGLEWGGNWRKPDYPHVQWRD
jgi:peptidoglycan L-alanyl-D-glutamate endopeptidase CwlK